MSHLIDRTIATTEPEHVPGLGPCLEWQGYRNKQGYGRAKLAGRMQYTHRAVWAEANGPIPNGLFVLHRCDNPACARLDHLFLGTHADNARDKADKGRVNAPRGDRHGSRTKPERLARGAANGSRLHPERLARGDANGARLHPESRARGDLNGSRLHPERLPRGEAHGCAKLTEEKVRDIRSRAAAGETQLAIGRSFGVHQATVSLIVLRKKWAHVGDAAPCAQPEAQS